MVDTGLIGWDVKVSEIKHEAQGPTNQAEDGTMNINFAELKTCLASSIQNAVRKTRADMSELEKKGLVDELLNSVNAYLDGEAARHVADRELRTAGGREGAVFDRATREHFRSNTRCGYVKFECGTKYYSKGIELHEFHYASDGRWSFILPVDAQPKGRLERDGRCSLHLKDGRVGQCHCTEHDEKYLRFEGIGTLEKRKLPEVVGTRA